MKSKVFIFIGLIVILSNATILSSDQQPLEEVGKIKNADQVVIPEGLAIEIKDLVNKEIKQLTDQKTSLQGFYNKYVIPAGYIAGDLAIAWFQIGAIGIRIKNFCKSKYKFDYFSYKVECLLGKKDKDDFFREHFNITFPLALILVQQKLFSTAWNHKQKTAETIEKIDSEIARNQAIIAQLQQQQQ